MIALPLVMVGRSGKNKKKMKAVLLSTKAWLLGPFVRNQMIYPAKGTGLPNV